MKERGFRSLLHLASEAKCSYTTVFGLVNGDVVPWYSDGSGWRDVVYTFSCLLGCEPEDIWGEIPNSTVVFDSQLMVLGMVDNAYRQSWDHCDENPVNVLAYEEIYDKLLSRLSTRTKDIVLDYFSGATLNSISRKWGICRERIRQIVDKAVDFLRRLWRGYECGMEKQCYKLSGIKLTYGK
jgi:hypothetical protein